MKTASPALITHLSSSQQFLIADLYTLTLASGLVARFTSSDRAQVSGGHTFYSSLHVRRSSTKAVTGIQIDTLTLTVSASQDVTLGGISFLAACVRGDLDGAQLRLERAFFSDWGLPAIGTVQLFTGQVADVDVDRLEATIQVKSALERFNVLLPRRIYQAGCSNSLYDASCGLLRASYAVGAAVVAGSTLVRVAFNSPVPEDWGTLGTLRFTSGVNQGQTRTVKFQSSTYADLSHRLLAVPAVGDGIILQAGCDKTLATCIGKFGNKARFRGQPYIPRPESAL